MVKKKVSDKGDKVSSKKNSNLLYWVIGIVIAVIILGVAVNYSSDSNYRGQLGTEGPGSEFIAVEIPDDGIGDDGGQCAPAVACSGLFEPCGSDNLTRPFIHCCDRDTINPSIDIECEPFRKNGIINTKTVCVVEGDIRYVRESDGGDSPLVPSCLSFYKLIGCSTFDDEYLGEKCISKTKLAEFVVTSCTPINGLSPKIVDCNVYCKSVDDGSGGNYTKGVCDKVLNACTNTFDGTTYSSRDTSSARCLCS